MTKRQRIKGYDPAGLLAIGGVALAVSAVLLYGRSETPFLIEEYRVPGAFVPGVIILLAASIASLGKRFGSRIALVAGSLIGGAIGGLSVWARFGNLSEMRDAGVDLATGFWMGMGGSILATVGGIVGVIVGLVASRTADAGTRVAVPPPPPPPPPVASTGWVATHHVPMEGMPATSVPDPTADIVATLEPGLGVQLVERRGDWARVRSLTGREVWVDARKLEPAQVLIG